MMTKTLNTLVMVSPFSFYKGWTDNCITTDTSEMLHKNDIKITLSLPGTANCKLILFYDRSHLFIFWFSDYQG